MDSGPSNICHRLIPSNLLQYIWYQGILFSSSFSFCSRGEINSPANSCTSSNTKPPPVHGTHLHYMGVCSPSSVYHQLVPACLCRHAIQGTIHTTRQVMEGYLGYLKRYTVFLLFAKTDTYHLMMVAFTYNNATRLHCSCEFNTWKGSANQVLHKINLSESGWISLLSQR